MSAQTLIHQFVEQANRGELERVIIKLPSGWAVMGDPQVLPGYCLLYPDPVVPHLNALAGEARAQFLLDMAKIGDAVLQLTGAVRINYEMLGNQAPALHAHIIPRFDNESDDLKTLPIWSYDWQGAEPFSLNMHGEMLEKLRALLSRQDDA